MFEKVVRVQNDMKQVEKQSGEEYAFWIRTRLKNLHLLVISLQVDNGELELVLCKGYGDVAVKLDVILH